SRGGTSRVPADADPAALVKAGSFIREIVAHLPVRRTLVMMAVPSSSRSMVSAGDEVTALFMSEGLPQQLFPPTGPVHSLTSDTTRWDGLVSNVDVAPTILRFFGIPEPSAMDGVPIRVVDAAAPFALHRRELEQRRTRLPVWLALLAFVVAA